MSAGTVSRAFAHPGRVSVDTSRLIMTKAAELGYLAPTPRRRDLRPLPQTIAMAVPDTANPYYSELIRGAQEGAESQGYLLVLCHTSETGEREQAALDRVQPLVSGVLLAGPRMSDAAVRRLARKSAVVVLNRAMSDVQSLVPDTEQASRLALAHLAELGHLSFTFLAGPADSWIAAERWRTLRAAAAEVGVRARRVGPFSPTRDGGRAAAAQVRSTESAVVAYNSLMALGAVEHCHAMGRPVPTSMSVVGFDNTLLAEVMQPALTTVGTPVRQQATVGARNLIAIIGGAEWTQSPLTLPSRLIVRHSTAKPSSTR